MLFYDENDDHDEDHTLHQINEMVDDQGHTSFINIT